jgi:hypothetical protein
MLVRIYKLHGVTYKGTVILISTVMGSSDLNKMYQYSQCTCNGFQESLNQVSFFSYWVMLELISGVYEVNFLT